MIGNPRDFNMVFYSMFSSFPSPVRSFQKNKILMNWLISGELENIPCQTESISRSIRKEKKS